MPALRSSSDLREVNMADLTVWICVLLIWMAPDLCTGMLCSTLEEGTSYTLDCTTYYVKDSIMVQLHRSNGEFVEVSSCNYQGTCINWMAPVYVSKFTTTQQNNDSIQYHNSLTITSVNRTEISFNCLVDGRSVGLCYLEVYVKPEKPTCDPLKFDDSGKYLNITCRTLKVWPAAQSVIGYKGAVFPDPESEFNSIVYPSPTSPGYVATEVAGLVSLSYMAPSIHEFYIVMMPIISDTLKAAIAAVSSDTVQIELKAPTAAISDDCPVGTDVKEGYIKSGSTATCKCELANVGYPRGQTQWYTDIGTKVGNIDTQEGSSTLYLSYDLSEPRPRFECRANTPLKLSSPAIISLSPKFAFGPNSVIAEFPDGNEFNLCPSEEYHLKTVTCKVPFDHVEPNVSFSLTDNGIKVGELNQGILISNFYIYSYQFRPSGGGRHHIVCKAENSLFPEISRETVYELDVKEPPSSAPFITVSGNQSVKEDKNVIATEGTKIVVTCRVDGGVPEVSEVVLVCGSTPIQVQSKIAMLDLEIKKSLDGQICSCSAWHVSGCYVMESHFVLRVLEASLDAGGSTDDGSSTDDSWKMWLGIGLGAAALIIFVVVIFVVWLRRKRTPATSDNGANENNAYEPHSLDSGYAVPVEAAPRLEIPYEGDGDHYDRITLNSTNTDGGNGSVNVWTVGAASWTGQNDYIDPL